MYRISDPDKPVRRVVLRGELVVRRSTARVALVTLSSCAG
jgi:hypothetical protein